MKIVIAKDAGYCFGVRDAVNLAYESTEQHGRCLYVRNHRT
jgi:4-hydroxy-3-methylbut-2-enyl diphosphate reductase